MYLDIQKIWLGTHDLQNASTLKFDTEHEQIATCVGGTLSSSEGGTEEGTGGGGGSVSGGVSNSEEMTGPANSGFKDTGPVCVATWI